MSSEKPSELQVGAGTFESEEDGPHAHFRDLCLLCDDFNRGLFLEEIISRFVRSANHAELKAIREAVSVRAKSISLRSRRGRPRAEDDERWMQQALGHVWQRIVLGWKWPRIAEFSEMSPTKANIRTVQRRCDAYAAALWKALPPYSDCGLDEVLANPRVPRLLRSRLGLPFDSHPKECLKIVRALAPRGAKAATAPIVRILRKSPRN